MSEPDLLQHRFLEGTRGACARLDNGKTCGVLRAGHISAVKVKRNVKKPIVVDCVMCPKPARPGSRSCSDACAAKFKDWRKQIDRGGNGASMARSGYAPGPSSSRFTRNPKKAAR
jgi:hypothetical protein